MKNTIVRVEVLEEIPTKKPEITEEVRIDGCIIEFEGDGDKARECYEAIVTLLENAEYGELLEIEDSAEE